MADNIQQVRQLISKYWQGVITLITAIFAFIKLYFYDFSKGSPKIQIAVTIGIALAVFIIIRFPKITFTLTRWILGKPELPTDLQIFRGPRPYFEGDYLPGRQAEYETCWQLIQSTNFFILQGESGSGKSSFLNARLKPKLSEKFRVVECRLIDDPINNLINAFSQKQYDHSEELPNIDALSNAIASAQTNYSKVNDLSDVKKPIVLIIDQSEELFVTVKDVVRLQVLDSIKKAISSGQMKVVLAIRNDFLDLLLTLCRDIDPKQQVYNLGNFFELLAFSENKGKPVLDKMLEPLHQGDPLKKQQLDAFSDKLILELLRPPRDKRIFQGDEKSILPVELQITGMMIETIGIQKVIDSGIESFGGKIGLLRSYVENAKDYVRRKTGVDGDKSLLILRQLVSPARTKWAQTPEKISENIGISADQVINVLNAFADKYLVKLLPVSDGEKNAGLELHSMKYEFMHEHLVRILIEAPQTILQRARDAEERLQFWNKRTEATFATEIKNGNNSWSSRLKSLYAQPIPISETISLWPFASNQDDKRILKKNIRGFTARILSFSLPIILAIAAFFLWTHTDDYLVKKMIPDAPVDQFAVSEEQSDIHLAADWAKALAAADIADTAFSTIQKMADNDSKSSEYAVLSLRFSLMNVRPLADSAFVKSIDCKDVTWNEYHELAVLQLFEVMAKSNTQNALYRQILGIKDVTVQLNALVSYMEASFLAHKMNDGNQIFEAILSKLKYQNDVWLKSDIITKIIENATKKKRKSIAETAMKLVLADSTFVIKTDYFDTASRFSLNFFKLNNTSDALMAWRAALSAEIAPIDEFHLESVMELAKEANTNKVANHFYDAAVSNNYENQSTRNQILKWVSIGTLIYGDGDDYTLRKEIVNPIEKFICYSTVIDSMLQNKRVSDARRLADFVLTNKIPQIALCDSTNNSLGRAPSALYEFLKSLITMQDYNTAKKIAFENDCDIRNNKFNFAALSPIGFVLKGMAENGKCDEAYASVNYIKNPFERNYVIAVLGLERLKSNQDAKANQLFKEVFANFSKLKSNGKRNLLFSPRNKTQRNQIQKNGEYPIKYIVEQAAAIDRLDVSLKLSDKLSEYSKNSSLNRIAAILLDKKNFNNIHKLIDKITDPQSKSELLIQLVVALADSDNEKALQLLPEIQNPHDISTARAAIAKYEARKKNFSKAREIAGTCLPKEKLEIYTTILEQYAILKNPKLKAALDKEKILLTDINEWTEE